MQESMRVAIGQFSELTHERLIFAKQLGVSGIQLNTPIIPGEKFWTVEDLSLLRRRCEQYGLRLEALENTPLGFYDKAMLGLPGRDEQIDNYRQTIRNMGRAGIPLLGYHWMPNDVWRTSDQVAGRGGARVSAFDAAQLATHALVYSVKERPQGDGTAIPAGYWAPPDPDSLRTGHQQLGADKMWENYFYFIRAVLPVAEESGVKLALHPDDPPIPEIGGVTRIFWNFDGFKRAMEEAASPNHGLDFCMGCWSEMGPGVLEAIRYFGERGKIFYVHLRDVQGCVPSFQECFLGEGNVNVVEALKLLKELGFTGFILDDHVPHMVDDTEWGHRGHAYTTGYIQGILAAMEG